ncbi:MAG TPA: hypothetical protein EYQ73_04815 [Candidatus Poseidoniales archaeon]|jgi:ABC-type transport system involved in multi-copper enzyme maturation permease subunit|nr:MAG: hypothetical protein CXT71_02775 [Euryarchaeota archaeon]HIF46104.1 hypothetical protein [Candidatus Poseidoniales archaeon]HIL64828.1 hypothetical protein [Candidatus Poseidoniales archaeon]
MNSTLALAGMIMRDRLKAGRMMVIWPLLAMFIIFSSWGLSDPKANLPVSLTIDSAYDVMYASTAFIIFSATLGAVLISFDGISRDRITGVLELKLSQPMQRSKQAYSMIIGHSLAIIIPVTALNFLAVLIIGYRLNEFPSLFEYLTYTISTALLLLWYTSIQLLASSYAKDMGSSIAVGLGVWMTFTLLWLIMTTVVAGLMGISVTDLNSDEYIRIEAIIDLFSPNGVYHHLLEMNLDGFERKISPIIPVLAAIIWSIIPVELFRKKIEKMTP